MILYGCSKGRDATEVKIGVSLFTTEPSYGFGSKVMLQVHRYFIRQVIEERFG